MRGVNVCMWLHNRRGGDLPELEIETIRIFTPIFKVIDMGGFDKYMRFFQK